MRKIFAIFIAFVMILSRGVYIYASDINSMECPDKEYFYRCNMNSEEHPFGSNGRWTLTYTADGGYNGTGGISAEVDNSSADLSISDSYSVKAGVPYVLSIKVKPTGTTTPEMFLDGTQDMFEFFFEVGKDNHQYLNSENATYENLGNGWYKMNYVYTYPTTDGNGNTVTEWTLGNGLIMRFAFHEAPDPMLTFIFDDLEIVPIDVINSTVYQYECKFNDDDNVNFDVNYAKANMLSDGGYGDSKCLSIVEDSAAEYCNEIYSGILNFNTNYVYTFSFKVKPQGDSTIGEIISDYNLYIHDGGGNAECNYAQYKYSYTLLEDGWYLCEAKDIRFVPSKTLIAENVLTAYIILYKGATKESFFVDDISITPKVTGIVGNNKEGETISLNLTGDKYYWYEVCSSSDGINWDVIEDGVSNDVITYEITAQDAGKYIKIKTTDVYGDTNEYKLYAYSELSYSIADGVSAVFTYETGERFTYFAEGSIRLEQGEKVNVELIKEELCKIESITLDDVNLNSTEFEIIGGTQPISLVVNAVILDINSMECPDKEYFYRCNMNSEEHPFGSNGRWTLTYTADGGYDGTGGISAEVDNSSADLSISDSYAVKAGVPYVLSIKVKPTGTTTPEMFLDETQDMFEFFFEVSGNHQYLNSENATYENLGNGWYKMNYVYTYPTTDGNGNQVTEWTLGNGLIMRFAFHEAPDPILTFILDDLEIVPVDVINSAVYQYECKFNDDDNVYFDVNYAKSNVLSEGGYGDSKCLSIVEDSAAEYCNEIYSGILKFNTNYDYTFSFKVKPQGNSTIDEIISDYNLYIHDSGGNAECNYAQYKYSYTLLEDGWYLCEAKDIRFVPSKTLIAENVLTACVVLYRGATKESFLVDDISITPNVTEIVGNNKEGETISLDLPGDKYYWYEVCTSSDGINWDVIEDGVSNGVITYKITAQDADKYIKIKTKDEFGDVKEYKLYSYSELSYVLPEGVKAVFTHETGERFTYVGKGRITLEQGEKVNVELIKEKLCKIESITLDDVNLNDTNFEIIGTAQPISLVVNAVMLDVSDAVIFRTSDDILPGEIFNIYGDALETAATLYIREYSSEVDDVLPIINVDPEGNFLTAKLPNDANGGQYIIHFDNNEDFAVLNAPRPQWIEDTKVACGQSIRIFGQGLSPDNSGCESVLIKLESDELGTIYPEVLSYNPYAVEFKIDDNTPTGIYKVYVSKGDDLWVEPEFDEYSKEIEIISKRSDPLNLGKWWADDFNWDSELSVGANNGADISSKLQTQINFLSALGGGVVNIGEGEFYLRSRINLKDNVVIRGAGVDKTTIIYNSNAPNIFEGGSLQTGCVGLCDMKIVVNPEQEGKYPDALFLAKGNDIEKVFIKNVKSEFPMNLRWNGECDDDGYYLSNDGRGKTAIINADHVLIADCSFSGYCAVPEIAHNGLKYLTMKNCDIYTNAGYIHWVGSCAVVENVKIEHDKEAENPYKLNSAGIIARGPSYIANNIILNCGQDGLNDGEVVLLECAGQPDSIFGDVVETNGKTLTVNSHFHKDTFDVNDTNLWSEWHVMIVDGKGMGQYRIIEDYDSETDTITVNKEWKVEPDETSKFATFLPMKGTIIYNNTAQDCEKGFWLYLNALDCVIAENTGTNTTGCYSRSITQRSEEGISPNFRISYYNKMVGNNIKGVSSLHKASSIGEEAMLWVEDDSFAYSSYAGEIRDNMYDGNNQQGDMASTTVDCAGINGIFMGHADIVDYLSKPVIKGGIISGNTVINSDYGITIGGNQNPQLHYHADSYKTKGTDGIAVADNQFKNVNNKYFIRSGNENLSISEAYLVNDTTVTNPIANIFTNDEFSYEIKDGKLRFEIDVQNTNEEDNTFRALVGIYIDNCLQAVSTSLPKTIDVGEIDTLSIEIEQPEYSDASSVDIKYFVWTNNHKPVRECDIFNLGK